MQAPRWNAAKKSVDIGRSNPARFTKYARKLGIRQVFITDALVALMQEEDFILFYLPRKSLHLFEDIKRLL